MSMRTIAAGSSVALLLGVVAMGRPARAATTGANGTHDPSRIIESNGKFYVYSTGGGTMVSTDGLAWKTGTAPSWNQALLANNEGIWAPDGIYLNGQYLLFYAMYSASKAGAIGLITSPTLDPSSSSYKWTDRGVVVSSLATSTFATIDPCPILDTQGNLWLSWGGGYPYSTSANSIWVTRLDNATGLPLTSDPAYKPPASPGYPIEQGHKEGSYLYYHAGYYFLWYQTGSCCSGASSSYEMHVARATSITGPYSGDRVFLASHDSIHGPGQIGIYDKCGASRFTYHYYPDTGGSVLGENELTWGSDGWPVAGVESTTAVTPCDQTSTGGTSGSGGNGASGGSAGSAGGTSGGTGGTTGGSGGAAGARGGAGGVQGATGGTRGSGGVAGGGGEQGATGGALGSGGAGGEGSGGQTGMTGGAPGNGGSNSGGTTGDLGTGGAGIGGGGGAALATGGSAGAEDSSSASGCSCQVSREPDLNSVAGVFVLVGLAIGAARVRRGRKARR